MYACGLTSKLTGGFPAAQRTPKGVRVQCNVRPSPTDEGAALGKPRRSRTAIPNAGLNGGGADGKHYGLSNGAIPRLSPMQQRRNGLAWLGQLLDLRDPASATKHLLLHSFFPGLCSARGAKA